MDAQSVVGTWRLVEAVARRDDGRELTPYGKEPVGTLVYQPDGRMVTVIVSGDLAPFESDNIAAATPAEASNAFRRSLAYFGTYEVDADGETVSHRIEGCAFPNWAGASHLRRARLEGDRLVLATPALPAAGGGAAEFTLTWERA